MKKWFENLKISKKMIYGFLFVAILGILIGVVGIINLINMIDHQQKAYDQCTLGIKYASKAEADFMALGKSMSMLQMNRNDTGAREQYEEKVENYFDVVDADLEAYSSTIADAEDQTRYEAAQTAYASYTEIIKRNIDILKTASSSDDLSESVAQASSVAQEATDALTSLVEYNDTNAKENLSGDKTSAMIAILIMIVIIILSFVIALLLGRYISNIISKPMQKFAAFAGLLADGDIDVGKVTEEMTDFGHSEMMRSACWQVPLTR